MSKIFAGDLADIRKTVRNERSKLKEVLDCSQYPIDRAIQYSRPEIAKSLRNEWTKITQQIEATRSELRRLQELVESVEKKNEIQYQD